jgi:hypothetical protein
MFAEPKSQAGLRAHEHMITMQTNRLPTSRTQWPLIRRYSFTVAGAAPGLVLSERLKTRTGFPFNLPSFSVDPDNGGKAPDNFAGEC